MSLPARLHYHVRDESFSRPEDRVTCHELPGGMVELRCGPHRQALHPDAGEYQVNRVLNGLLARQHQAPPAPSTPAAHFPPWMTDKCWPGG